MSKTLQAMTEEEAERKEQEELERQERGMLDMQAQQQLAEAQQRAQEAGEQQEGGEVVEERNLDDEVPDADAEAGEGDGEVTFNESSLVEGDSQIQHQDEENEQEQRQYAEMEEAELTGAAQAEEELGIVHEDERNLDDSIPEAGSYQHTDTELEDSDSESELQDSFAAQSARRSSRRSQGSSILQPHQSAQTPTTGSGQMAGGLSAGELLEGGLQARMRAQIAASDALPRSPGSLNLSSSLLESSFVGSSPMMQRANNQGGRSMRGGAVRRRGRMS